MATGNVSGGASGAEAGVGYISLVPEATKIAKYLKTELGKEAEKAGKAAGKDMFDAIGRSDSAKTTGKKLGEDLAKGIKEEVEKTKTKLPTPEIPKLPDLPDVDLRFNLDPAAFDQADRELETLRNEVKRLAEVDVGDPFKRFGRDLAAAGIDSEIDDIAAEFRKLNDLAKVDGKLDIEGAERLKDLRDQLEKLQRDAKNIQVEIDNPPAPDFGPVVAAGDRAGTESGDVFGASFLSKGAGVLKSGAAALFASVAAAAGVALKGAFEDNRGEALLGASIGDPQDAAAIGDLAGQLYVNAYGDSVNDNLPVLRQLYRYAGEEVSGEFYDQAAAANNFAEVFDIDAAEVVRIAGVMQQQGLGPLEENLAALIRTGQRVPTEMLPDVLDAFEEYSGVAAQAGFDTEEFASILAAQSFAGPYALDKAGDAIKEFSIRATDGSKLSSEAFDAIGLNAEETARKVALGGDEAAGAFDDTVAGLLAIEDPALQAQTAIALFGTPLEDIGTSKIPDFLEALQGGEVGLADLGTAFTEFDDQTNDQAGLPFEAFKRGIRQNLVDFGREEMLPFLDEAVLGLRNFYTAATTGMTEDEGGTFIEDLGLAVFDLKEKFKEYWPEIQATINDVVESIRGILESLRLFWEEWGDEITAVMERLLPVVVVVFESMVATIEGAFDLIEGFLQVFVGVWTGDWEQFWSGIQNILSGAWTVLNAITFGALQGLVNSVKSFFSEMVSTIAEKFGATEAEAAALPGKIKDALGDMGTFLIEAGKDLVEGFIRGIKDKTLDAVAAAKNMASEAARAATDFLGISSPSKLFTEYGENVAQGFTIGIETEAPASVDTAAQWAAQVSAAFEVAPIELADAPAGRGDMNVEIHNDGRPLLEQLNEVHVLRGALVGV